MYFPPAPFDLDRARLCLALVNTGYDMYSQWTGQDKPKEADFQWNPTPPPGTDFEFSEPIWGTDTVFWFFHHPEPFAFVSWNPEGDVYLAIRGTESVDDWVEDADVDQKPYTLAPGYGNVHHGFNTIYETMSEAVASALAKAPDPKRLFITGHSLGSSLSTLAVPDIITNTDFTPERFPVFQYNFASPRTGDPEFAAAYIRNRVPTWRVVNSSDIVPNVPPACCFGDFYEHVGTQISYTAQYDSLGGNHSSTSSYGYALAHPDQPQGPLPPDS